jgi:hypothetical protein
MNSGWRINFSNRIRTRGRRNGFRLKISVLLVGDIGYNAFFLLLHKIALAHKGTSRQVKVHPILIFEMTTLRNL